MSIVSYHCSVPSSPTLMSNAPSRIDLSSIDPSLYESSRTVGVHHGATYNYSSGTLAVEDGHGEKRWGCLRVFT